MDIVFGHFICHVTPATMPQPFPFYIGSGNSIKLSILKRMSVLTCFFVLNYCLSNPADYTRHPNFSHRNGIYLR